MIVSIIVAVGYNGVIGNKNKLPWNLPSDMRHFRKLTKGKPIIMGASTFLSIGRTLPGRDNIVLTRDPEFKAPGCRLAFSLDQALKMARESLFAKEGEVMICGGVSVYRQYLPLADRMYLTLIEGDFEGDAFFPEFDMKEWDEKERIENQPDPKNPHKHTFLILERKSS